MCYDFLKGASNYGVLSTIKRLWSQDRWGFLSKGLTARLTQTIIYSSIVISCYETVKQVSVNEPYKKLLNERTWTYRALWNSVERTYQAL